MMRLRISQRWLITFWLALALTGCITPQYNGALAPTSPGSGDSSQDEDSPPADSPDPTRPVVASTQALNPAHIWVGVEGRTRFILTLDPESGEASQVSLPLNEGQEAERVVASADGTHLAYLVWSSENDQRGVARWELTNPDAYLIALPSEGYRITDIFLREDGSQLAFVEVEAELPLNQADWRIEVTGGMEQQPQVIATRDDVGDVFPPTLIAWPVDGPLMFNTLTTDNAAYGIYSADENQVERIVPLPDQDVIDSIIVAPILSPDQTRIAYLTSDPDAPGAPDTDRAPTNIVRVVELSSGNPVDMIPDENQAIFGVRWYTDNIHLLMDMVEFPDDPNEPLRQLWANVTIGQPQPWPVMNVGPERDYLLDYEPLGEGVVYTVLPATTDWELYLITGFNNDDGLITFSLDGIAREGSAPTIIYAP